MALKYRSENGNGFRGLSQLFCDLARDSKEFFFYPKPTSGDIYFASSLRFQQGSAGLSGYCVVPVHRVLLLRWGDWTGPSCLTTSACSIQSLY